MSDSLFWYDLETSGTQPKWDRIVQFAGVRTDLDLNVVDDPVVTYVRLADDVLPDPAAALVTGITPQLCNREGIAEVDALLQINRLFSQPGTTTVGYNSLRFDDEFVRYGLYRHLLDPYAREWQNGNSRWDLLDLVRAAGALRRDGIEWPVDEAGLPVYRLAALAAANGLQHDQAHDAMSDVDATLGFARLLKQHQPRLWDYYFSQRFKRQVRKVLEPYGAHLCVHVSGMYPRQRSGVAPIVSICRHPTNSNAVVVADLAEDISPLLDWPAEKIREELFKPRADADPAVPRPPLKEIRINRCPFVATIDVLNEENYERLQLDRKLIKENARRLARPDLAAKIARVYTARDNPPNTDVDAALYDKFLVDADRSRCQRFHEALATDEWLDMDFADSRLIELRTRLKARNYPARLTGAERDGWREFVRDKLAADADWMGLARYRTTLAEVAGELPDGDEAGTAILQALGQHGDELAQRYGLTEAPGA